jgi:hypothetical protein
LSEPVLIIDEKFAEKGGRPMAKTALSLLQDQIEAIRREAYAAGYAAAMQAVRDFSGRPAAGAASAPVRRRGPAATPAPAKVPARRGRPPGAAAKPARAARRRPQRGTNARLISEILKEAGSDFVRPAAIRTALQRDKGASVAFTSIRHALGQLQAQSQVEQSADGKSWHYTGS